MDGPHMALMYELACDELRQDGGGAAGAKRRRLE